MVRFCCFILLVNEIWKKLVTGTLIVEFALVIHTDDYVQATAPHYRHIPDIEVLVRDSPTS